MIQENTINQGDSLKLVDGIEDSSIDMLITDPPYNISTDFELQRDSCEGGAFSGKDLSHDYEDWDKQNLTVEEWLPLFEPVLKENSTIIVFYDYMKLGNLISVMESMEWDVRQPVVWHKKNPVPQGYGVKWQEAVEMGMIATVNEGEGHKFQKEGQRHNVIETPVCSGNERYEHPTQKPEGLAKPIYKWWTADDDTILDPFCGTGTFCAVAKRMGRKFIGIEKSEGYYEIARDRVENVENISTDKSIFDL